MATWQDAVDEAAAAIERAADSEFSESRSDSLKCASMWLQLAAELRAGAGG